MNLDEHTPSFTDITSWEKRKFYNTRGSREKVIVVDQNEKLFYFKGSKETIYGEVRYPTEFWSEIASSKIGKYLGFNLLDYNIAYDENESQKIGCLSESMIIEGEETLTEGIGYLTGFDPTYNPELDKKKYTFQFILEALKSQSLEKFIPHLVEVIIFDAIISNSDRHQENWGLIYNHKFIAVNPPEEIKKPHRISFLEKLIIRLFGSKFDGYVDNETFTPPKLDLQIRFSPIYDSGCSLGREREGSALTLLLSKSENLEKYISKGLSEIHWEGKKIDHFTLVSNLYQLYPSVIKNVIKRIEDHYKKEDVIYLINHLDKMIPIHLKETYFLTQDRKTLMQKLLILRIEKLLSLL